MIPTLRPILVLALLGLIPACAGTMSSYRDRDQTEAMEAVLRTQETAWNRGDLERFLAEGYLRSPGLTFYSGGEVSRGFDTILDHYRKSYQGTGKEMGRLSFTDLETVLFGPEAGIVRGRWKLEFERKSPAGGLFTLVMQRTAEGWRIVHDHTSVASAG